MTICAYTWVVGVGTAIIIMMFLVAILGIIFNVVMERTLGGDGGHGHSHGSHHHEIAHHHAFSEAGDDNQNTDIELPQKFHDHLHSHDHQSVDRDHHELIT